MASVTAFDVVFLFRSNTDLQGRRAKVFFHKSRSLDAEQVLLDVQGEGVGAWIPHLPPNIRQVESFDLLLILNSQID